MNKSLLYLLADAGLLDKDGVHAAQEGDRLLRGVCPVHPNAADKTAFVLETDRWFCNTAKCHQTYGCRLEGLIVALADRHGGPELTSRDSRGLPAFREAKAWVKRNVRRLREVFEDWQKFHGTARPRPSGSGSFSFPRQDILDALAIPAWYFVAERGLAIETVRRYDIGKPRRQARLFARLKGHAIVPLYDLGGSGRCVGYAARNVLSFQDSRWRFSVNFATGQRLFNYAVAREVNRQTGQVVLVEGVVDALRCVEAGYPQAIALLGSELYPEQIEWLAKLRLDDVVVLADNDEAGAKLAHQVKARLSGLAGAVRAVWPPATVKDVGAMTTPAAREFLQRHLAAA